MGSEPRAGRELLVWIWFLVLLCLGAWSLVCIPWGVHWWSRSEMERLFPGEWQGPLSTAERDTQIDGELEDELVAAALRKGGLISQQAFDKHRGSQIWTRNSLEARDSLFYLHPGITGALHVRSGLLDAADGLDKQASIWIGRRFPEPLYARNRGQLMLTVGLETPRDAGPLGAEGTTGETPPQGEKGKIGYLLQIHWRVSGNANSLAEDVFASDKIAEASIVRFESDPSKSRYTAIAHDKLKDTLELYRMDSVKVWSWVPYVTGLNSSRFPRTITVVSDEEAVATWFLSVVQREESLRRQSADQNKPEELQITKDLKGKLVRTIEELIRFRLAGAVETPTPGENSSDAFSAGQDISQYLRWPMWLSGSDTFGTWIMTAIYSMTIVGLLTVLFRLVVLCIYGSIPESHTATRSDAGPLMTRMGKLVLIGPALLPLLPAWLTVVTLLALALLVLVSCPAVSRAKVAIEWFWRANGHRPQPSPQLTWITLSDLVSDIITYMLPAAGFLGTICGLGRAFGAVGIISEILLLQKQALMGVLLNLGTAFSTTFWALAAGLLVVPLFLIARALEAPVLQRLDEEAERELMKKAMSDALHESTLHI
ncbi:MAG: hypothetical protein KDA90_21835 [Planctomycetaceae bacterium]|nr:hypothetical protein [Planctomycetaceae bacterium]